MDLRGGSGTRFTPGILTLAHVIHHHWWALYRDVLALGYRAKDMFTDQLTTPAMIAIAQAPPGTAVHHAITEGWSPEAHLLANLSEQSAGLIQPPDRYPRPGMKIQEPQPTSGGFSLFGSIAEFEARRAETFRKE